LSAEKCKVLVVDDHRDGADSAVLLLQMWGHDAIAAYTAEQALQLAASFDPDVVLMDIGLPGNDGFDVADQIRGRCPAARLVALTGFTREHIVRRSREAGFDDHLTKPADPAVLKDVVATQCEQSSRPPSSSRDH
jgi:CheY-like chemotaxis protein